MVFRFNAPVLSRDPAFQHLKPISTKAFEVCRPSKPSTLLTMPDPINEFDLTLPTYQQITNIIRKMKKSCSPCPLDQISIICFRAIRKYPEEWKKACTILIHKKDNSDSPSNFRSITLQTIKNYWMRLSRISELFRPRSALSAEAEG